MEDLRGRAAALQDRLSDLHTEDMQSPARKVRAACQVPSTVLIYVSLQPGSRLVPYGLVVHNAQCLPVVGAYL